MPPMEILLKSDSEVAKPDNSKIWGRIVKNKVDARPLIEKSQQKGQHDRSPVFLVKKPTYVLQPLGGLVLRLIL